MAGLSTRGLPKARSLQRSCMVPGMYRVRLFMTTVHAPPFGRILLAGCVHVGEVGRPPNPTGARFRQFRQLRDGLQSRNQKSADPTIARWYGP